MSKQVEGIKDRFFNSKNIELIRSSIKYPGIISSYRIIFVPKYYISYQIEIQHTKEGLYRSQ